MKYFFEIDFSHLRGHIVLLDIDGTIASDRVNYVCQKTLQAINKLKANNRVYLLSNNKDKERLEQISENTGLGYIDSFYRKPRRRILNKIEYASEEKFFMIGDQVCTDVLFAKRIGAQYLQVKRLLGKNDSLKMKTVYFFDDLVGMVLRLFMKI